MYDIPRKNVLVPGPVLQGIAILLSEASKCSFADVRTPVLIDTERPNQWLRVGKPVGVAITQGRAESLLT
jgi:hypothetical protein